MDNELFLEHSLQNLTTIGKNTNTKHKKMSSDKKDEKSTGYDDVVKEGKVRKCKHPTKELYGYNYKDEARYSKKFKGQVFWSPEVMASRGLVLNKQGQVVGRPFIKFFNVEEKEAALSMKDIEKEIKQVKIYEKLDGSMIVLFWDGQEWDTATRGSFSSKQATKAKEMLQKKYKDEVLDKSLTYVLEVIYPKNKIVVDYKDRQELVLLGAIDTASGKELDVESVKTSFAKPQSIQLESFDQFVKLMKEPWNNREGYVVVLGDKRVKVKYAQYKDVHACVFDVSRHKIWEFLFQGKGLDEWLKDVPDEAKPFIDQQKNELEALYKKTLEEATLIATQHTDAKDDEKTRKKNLSEWFDKANYDKKKRSLSFFLVMGKSVRKDVWKVIEPLGSDNVIYKTDTDTS